MALNKCRICDATEFDEMLDVKEMMFGTRKSYKYLKCSFCGVLQIEEPINDPKLLYPINYRSFDSMRKNLKNRIKRILIKNTIAKSLGVQVGFFKLSFKEHLSAKSLSGRINTNMSILDVGCGSGELIEALYFLGYKKVEGTDPYISSEINNGWRVRKKFITDLPSYEKFDLIMFHHSFEHMDNPLIVLKKIYELLSDNGICMIRIPVCDSLAYDIYKSNWVQLDAPRHVFLHTNKSMELLSKEADLKIKEIKNDSYAFQFIGSEQYKKGMSLNSPHSYFRPFYKKIFRKTTFTKKIINSYTNKAHQLNDQGKGDQRIYILKKT